MNTNNSKLITEVEVLKKEFNKTTDKLIKNIRRKDKIIIKSDKSTQS